MLYVWDSATSDGALGRAAAAAHGPGRRGSTLVLGSGRRPSRCVRRRRPCRNGHRLAAPLGPVQSGSGAIRDQRAALHTPRKRSSTTSTRDGDEATTTTKEEPLRHMPLRLLQVGTSTGTWALDGGKMTYQSGLFILRKTTGEEEYEAQQREAERKALAEEQRKAEEAERRALYGVAVLTRTRGSDADRTDDEDDASRRASDDDSDDEDDDDEKSPEEIELKRMSEEEEAQRSVERTIAQLAAEKEAKRGGRGASSSSGEGSRRGKMRARRKADELADQQRVTCVDIFDVPDITKTTNKKKGGKTRWKTTCHARARVRYERRLVASRGFATRQSHSVGACFDGGRRSTHIASREIGSGGFYTAAPTENFGSGRASVGRMCWWIRSKCATKCSQGRARGARTGSDRRCGLHWRGAGEAWLLCPRARLTQQRGFSASDGRTSGHLVGHHRRQNCATQRYFEGRAVTPFF